MTQHQWPESEIDTLRILVKAANKVSGKEVLEVDITPDNAQEINDSFFELIEKEGLQEQLYQELNQSQSKEARQASQAMKGAKEIGEELRDLGSFVNNRRVKVTPHSSVMPNREGGLDVS